MEESLKLGTRTLALRFAAVRLADAGLYACKAAEPPLQSKRIHLDVRTHHPFVLRQQMGRQMDGVEEPRKVEGAAEGGSGKVVLLETKAGLSDWLFPSVDSQGRGWAPLQPTGSFATCGFARDFQSSSKLHSYRMSHL